MLHKLSPELRDIGHMVAYHRPSFVWLVGVAVVLFLLVADHAAGWHFVTRASAFTVSARRYFSYQGLRAGKPRWARRCIIAARARGVLESLLVVRMSDACISITA